MRIRFSEDFKGQPAVIKIIGVGGAGGNAVNRMVEVGLKHVEFIAANTDAQDLRRSRAHVKVQMGSQLTQGLGVGGDPAKGREAAEESIDTIKNLVTGANMVFIANGMGGGTGTGAAPLVAKLAKEEGALTIGIVSRPFEFEGRVRAQQAEAGIREMRNYVDTLLIIPNDKIFNIIDETTTTTEAYLMADDVLRKATQAITDVITTSGEINVDFADVRTIMKSAGEAIIGIGESEGSHRAVDAAKKAIVSPLLENVSIDGAKGALVNITASHTLLFTEIKEVMTYVHSVVSPEAHVFFGQANDENLKSKIRVTVIATGFPAKTSRTRAPHLREFNLNRELPVIAGETLRSISGRAETQSKAKDKDDTGDILPTGKRFKVNKSQTPPDDVLKKPSYLRTTTRRLR
ncbi:cell division protein FtsZ [Elusimicrobiota bacterium]